MLRRGRRRRTHLLLVLHREPVRRVRLRRAQNPIRAVHALDRAVVIRRRRRRQPGAPTTRCVAHWVVVAMVAMVTMVAVSHVLRVVALGVPARINRWRRRRRIVAHRVQKREKKSV